MRLFPDISVAFSGGILYNVKRCNLVYHFTTDTKDFCLPGAPAAFFLFGEFPLHNERHAVKMILTEG